MHKFRYIVVPFLVMLLFDISCSDNKIISDKEKFAALYVELQISLEKNRGNLNAVNSEREKIFRKYNVSKEQYSRTIEYLGQDKEKWDEFFNAVNVQLNKMRRKT